MQINKVNQAPSNKISFKAVPKFNPIDMDKWDGRDVYDFFMSREKPHVAACLPVDIKNLKDNSQKLGTTVNRLFMYAIGKAVNSIEPFRLRLMGNKLVSFEESRLSLPIPKKGTEGYFNFGNIDWHPDLAVFLKNCDEVIEETTNRASNLPAGAKVPDPDLIYLSHVKLPFTSIANPLNGKSDLTPRINWGVPNPFVHPKESDPILIPLGIEAHHSVISGSHIEKFVKTVQDTCNEIS